MTRDQRERLLAAVPEVVAGRGYETTSVADLVKAAAVSRNAFYKNFRDKQDCVAAAHEEGHARLLEVLSLSCDPDLEIEERVERSLAAALDALAADPALARFLFVEAPSAGEEIALRYHEWLGRYGALLRSADSDLAPEGSPGPDVGQVVVGGIASRIASEVLRGRGEELRALTAPFAEYVLTFFRQGEEPRPRDRRGEVVSLEPEREPEATELFEARKQAGA